MIGLFSFRGRSSRLAFWRVQLLLVALSAVVLSASYFAIIAVGSWGGIFLSLFPPLLIISVANYLRRLHDRGKNVLWLLIFTFGPWVSIAFAQELVAKGSLILAAASLPFSLGGLGIWVWGWIEVGFRRGEPKPNRFGDVPAAV